MLCGGELALIHALVHAVHERLGVTQHCARKRLRIIRSEGVDLDRADAGVLIDVCGRHPQEAPVEEFVVVRQPEGRVTEDEIPLRTTQNGAQIVVLGEPIDDVAGLQIG